MSRVIHFEIHAAQPNRAITFYEKVFGWKFQKMNGPIEYWLITTGPDDLPGINGGLIPRRGEIDGQAVIAFVCTIDIPSVDDTVKLISSTEGEIVVAKFPVQGVGWLVYCKETSLELWKRIRAPAFSRADNVARNPWTSSALEYPPKQ